MNQVKNRKSFQLVQSLTKRDQIVAAILDSIVRGEIEPGEAIIESKIGAQLGCGTPMVREALIELEYRGYVRKAPFKGTFVTKLSREEIEQIFEVRIELEAIAIEWARRHCKPADLLELKSLAKKMKLAANAYDVPEFYEHDIAFHRKLWELSGNAYLIEMLELVVVPLFAFFLMKTRRERKSYVSGAAEHDRIVEVLATSSPVKARQLMKEMVEHWRSEMTGVLFEGKK
jgi:DNA-binding GntR family transcriptional regulator